MMTSVDQLIVLRQLEPHDVEYLYRYRNDRSVVGQLGGHSHGYSRADLANWVERHRGMSNEVLWAIATVKDDRCIGHVGLYDIDHRIRKAEFGILLGDTDFHGKGVGKHVTATMIAYGFEQLNLRRISLTVLASNKRALALYEQLGFIVEGRFRDDDFRDGHYGDVVMMSILDHEWRS